MKIILFFIALLALSGCSSKGGIFPSLQPLAPEISLKNFQLVKMGLSQQTYRLRLKIKNPNAFPLPINNLNYQLFINNQNFAKGNSKKAVTIPSQGVGMLEIDVNSNIMDVIEGAGQWFSLAKRSLDYRITGNVGLSSLGIPLPFQYADKVNLLLTD